MDKIKICKNCQKEFETTRNTRKNVFCGHSCSATYNNQVREPMSEEQKKKISDSLKKAWKETPEKFPHGENHVQNVAKGTKNKYNREMVSILDVSSRTTSKILKRMNLGCCICGWNEGSCDVHHIYGRKIENCDSNENLTYLCPNHHRLVHENKIDKKNLIPLSQFLPDNWKDFYYG
jgi:hypothetical protein